MGVASVSVADGTAAAASNITDGATTRVTPGSLITVALQSSTGIRRWILSEDGTNQWQAIDDRDGAAILSAVKAIGQQELGSDYDEKEEA